MIKAFILLYCFFAFSIPGSAQKQPNRQQLEKGKTLAKACITCHGTTTAVLADPLQRIRKVRTADYIYKLMQNPMRFADENKTAKKVFAIRGLQMPAFPNLSKDELKAIFDYLDSLPYDKKNYKNRIKN
jgi:cytochrome c553